MTTIIQIGNKGTQIIVESDIVECKYIPIIRNRGPDIEVTFYINKKLTCGLFALEYESPYYKTGICYIKDTLRDLHKFISNYSLDEIFKMKKERIYCMDSVVKTKDSYIITLTRSGLYINISICESFIEQFNEAMTYVIWRKNLYYVLRDIRK